MNDLTSRQLQVLRAVGEYWRRGQPPCTGELLRDLQLARESSLTTLLKPLERKGYLRVQGGVRGRQRLLELTAAGRGVCGLALPVLGFIPAGPLQEAVQQAGEWVDPGGGLLSFQPRDFFLRVEGDSMTGAGILPGDLVLLRPEVRLSSGEIAAVQVHHDDSGSVEATLKHLDLLPKGRVRLRAANPAYQDRELDAEQVSVAGVFRGLVRQSAG